MKIIKIISFTALVNIVFVYCANAAGFIFDPGYQLRYTTELGNNDPATIAYSLVNWSLVFLGVITVIMIIIAGFLWIFAAGNEERVEKAKGILTGSVLGLVIIMGSYSLAQYVFTKLVEITL